jgi:NADH dehydrogenase [ubiquinone] 1 alpha subcomplex assembly factor 5
MKVRDQGMSNFEPFDRSARRRARDRAADLIAGRDQMLSHVADELAVRSELLGPEPEGERLWIGLLGRQPAGWIGLDPSPRLAALRGGLVGDEDRQHFADARFAQITAFMTFHGVNDLPGALLLCRRALQPGGRFQAAFPAGISMPQVREAFLTADVAGQRGVAPRVGPTVDPAEAAGLLQRAGFVEPVAEVDTLALRYRSLRDLALDVRAHGDSGWLAGRSRGLTTPSRWAAAEAAFALSAVDDGRITADVQILYLSGKVTDASAAM